MSQKLLIAPVIRFSPYPFHRIFFSSSLPRDTGHLLQGFLHRSSYSSCKNDDRVYIKAACSNCSGWDELLFPTAVDVSPDFLVSLGIDDKRNIFAFILGVIIAFGISRVRVSSIIVFPASALVFAVGFSLGFFHAGPFQFQTKATKRESNDEHFRMYDDNIKMILEILNCFDAKAGDLKRKVLDAIASRTIELSDLRVYATTIESMESLVSESRTALEGGMRTLKDIEAIPVENSKMLRGDSNAVAGVLNFLWQPISGLFKKNAGKATAKEANEKINVTQARVNSLFEDSLDQKKTAPANKELNSFVSNNEGEGAGISNAVGDLSEIDIGNDEVYDRKNPEDGFVKRGFTDIITTRFTFSEEFSFQNDGFSYRDANSGRFMDSKHFNVDDLGSPSRDVETNSSFVKRKKTKKSASAFTTSVLRFLEDDEHYLLKSGEGLERYESVGIEDVGIRGHETISSVISDDVLFDRFLTEAKNLQKQAKMCINDRYDENDAEILLNKSAKLLTKAVTMKPGSLLAVGQLGNTYLLHGELKLKVSRELRSIISTQMTASPKRYRSIIEDRDDRLINKDELVSNLAQICEECDELLLEAGRKYRFALSIDGNDIRALYNWGLSLSFRAQLIADIGPEAALDADKLFLAAIDKFDAMMSKSNAYAPDALFRWGMTLQQRSRLRPNNSKERVKLLQQAMRLYEDSMNMDNGKHSQAREALLSCASELNYRLR